MDLEPRDGVHNLYGVPDQAERAWRIAVGSPGPHAVPYAEMVADGASGEGAALIQVQLEDGLVTAVVWAHCDAQPFTIVGGLTSDDAAFVRACTDRLRHDSRPGRPLLAEAGGPLRARLLEAGFTEATIVRSYHCHPPGAPERTRPAQFLDCLHDDGPPGEFVYWLDWQHDGYHYDPRRTDAPGRPPPPRKGTHPHGDYCLRLAHDLRRGTFGHPWEQTLTVWGRALPTAIAGDLTELLGEPVRRRN
ncbi:DUF2716 domain-containing protein [Streptomyces toxytricini]|uniref:DUF2716 domain-containing protein n=1 Tax=Streptomyces toxytricini TaxID=67369 RepID=UPI00341E8969